MGQLSEASLHTALELTFIIHTGKSVDYLSNGLVTFRHQKDELKSLETNQSLFLGPDDVTGWKCLCTITIKGKKKSCIILLVSLVCFDNPTQ